MPVSEIIEEMLKRHRTRLKEIEDDDRACTIKLASLNILGIHSNSLPVHDEDDKAMMKELKKGIIKDTVETHLEVVRHVQPNQ